MGEMVVRGATVIDGRGADPSVRDVVIGGDGLIAEGGRSGGATLDLDGLTLLPGLIDAHTHIAPLNTVRSGTATVAEIAAEMFAILRDALDAGFTTLRDCGGVDGGLVRALERGLIPGPRVIPAGPILCQTGGHGHMAPPFAGPARAAEMSVPGLAEMSIQCDGPDAVRRGARLAFQRGARFLKMCVTGGVISHSDALTDTQFTVPELRAAVEEAAARGTYVTVHAHNNAGVRNAMEAGVRGVEHGTMIDAELAEQMAAAGMYLVPTLAVTEMLRDHGREHGYEDHILARLGTVGADMGNAAKIAYDAGVPVGSGSDLSGPGSERRGMEIALKARTLGAAAAIESATSVNARILGIADKVGTIAAGRHADVIAVDGDPLTDPGLLADPANVRVVIRAGEITKDARTA